MRGRTLEPLDVPASLWQRSDTRRALGDRDVGGLFQLVRQWTGASQTRIGLACGGLSQGEVSQIMKQGGRRITSIDLLERVADGLNMPDDARVTLGLAPCNAAAEQETPPPVPYGVLDLPAFQRGSTTRHGDGAAEAAAAMQSFRAADRQVGGGHLYASVVNYLQTVLAPVVFGEATGGESRNLFAAASALTEMAGWMAHDAGRDRAAYQHFSRAVDLVRLGGDHNLGVHVLASKSHLANHLNRPSEAIRLAREGQELLRSGPSNPGLYSRLLAMEARGHAAVHDGATCGRTLLRAEKALGEPVIEVPSPWVSGFDEASFASEAARCMRRLGYVDAAQRQAERVIELRPRVRARSRAFGQLILTTALVAQGKVDEACATAADVLDVTQSLGSFRVILELRELRVLLSPYRSSKAVSDFLPYLEQTLSERLWLYRWLAQSDHSVAGGRTPEDV